MRVLPKLASMEDRHLQGSVAYPPPSPCLQTPLGACSCGDCGCGDAVGRSWKLPLESMTAREGANITPVVFLGATAARQKTNKMRFLASRALRRGGLGAAGLGIPNGSQCIP